MADVLRYVNAASAPGGDGTTPATTGANRAWSGFVEAVTQANALKSTSDRWLVQLGGSTVDTLSAQLSITTNLNTTSDNPLVFQGPRRLVWDTGAYRLNMGNIGQPIVANASALFLEIDGIQLESPRTQADYLEMFGMTIGTGRFVLDRVLARGTGSVTGSNGVFVAVLGNTAYTFKMTNVILVNLPAVYRSGYSGACSSYLANITARTHAANSVDRSGHDTGSTFSLKNVVVHSVSGSGYLAGTGGPSGTIAKFVTSDATSPNVALRNLIPTFVDAANGDLRLASGDSVARNAGDDVSADTQAAGTSIALDEDLIGTARPQGAAWDIGAHELIEASVTGSGAVTLDSPTAAAAGTVAGPAVTGSGAVSLDSPSIGGEGSQAGTGTVVNPGASEGSGAVTLDTFVMTGDGVFILPVTGAGAVVLASPFVVAQGSDGTISRQSRSRIAALLRHIFRGH